MNTLEQIIAYVVAFGLLILAFRLAHKDKFKSCLVVAVLAFVACFSAQSWFQGLFKTEIISRAFSTLEGYGKKLDEFQSTTAKMRTELADHQTAIDKNQKELANQQMLIRTAQTNIAAQQGSITSQYAQIAQIQAKLASAQTNIVAQQEKLSDVTYWVSNLYSNMVTETIALSDTNKVVFNQSTNGSTCCCIISKHVPIPQSIQFSALSGEAINIPQSLAGPFALHKNLLLQGLVGYNVKTTVLQIQYVNDTRRTNVTEKVELRGDRVFVGDKLIGYHEGSVLYLTNDAF